MIPAYLSPLTNHVWQSTVFAAAAGLLTLALRKNHAQARHWIWLAASVKFLIPFALLIGIGSQLGWRATPARHRVYFVIEQVGQPFAAPLPALPTPAALPAGAASRVPVILLAV